MKLKSNTRTPRHEQRIYINDLPEEDVSDFVKSANELHNGAYHQKFDSFECDGKTVNFPGLGEIELSKEDKAWLAENKLKVEKKGRKLAPEYAQIFYMPFDERMNVLLFWSAEPKINADPMDNSEIPF